MSSLRFRSTTPYIMSLIQHYLCPKKRAEVMRLYELLFSVLEISVDHVVAAFSVAAVLCSAAHVAHAARVKSLCALSLCACLLVNLCSYLLEAVLKLLVLSLDVLCVSALESFLDSVELRFALALVSSVYLVAELAESLLDLEYHLVSRVSCVNFFLLLCVLSCKCLSVLDSLVDVLLGHICGRCDSDVLLLACAEVLSGNVNDTVSVDIECYLDLRDSSRSRSDAVELEHTELLVILSELTLTLENVDLNSCLVISSGGEYLRLLGRDSCVSLDELCANAAHCFKTERQRSYVEQEKSFLNVSAEYAALVCSAECNTLVRVDALERLFADEFLYSFLNSRYS